MKDIYTVVIVDSNTFELSTVSFTTFEAAKEYCMEEVMAADADANEEEVEQSLEEEMVYTGYNDTNYYIEEARLVEKA